MKKSCYILLILVFIISAFSLTACSGEKSLKGLGKKYEDELIVQAQINAGTKNGEFNVVVLGAEETKNYIVNYNFSPNINKDDIVAGLFVEYKISEDSMPIYYNFGLEFNSKQTTDVTVNFTGLLDTWMLEVVEENPKILFEYSIT